VICPCKIDNLLTLCNHIFNDERLHLSQNCKYLVRVLRLLFLPRLTVINIDRAMGRDEINYSDPEVFDPDRYLDPNVPPVPAFGWGRR
jgi:hypothetical protein